MIKTDELNYKDADTLCRGFIAYPTDSISPTPAVLIAPDWGGRGDDACNKAIELARMGYIGFAIDMYGQAQCPFDNEARRALMTPLVNDRKKLIYRIKSAFDVLTNLVQVDNTKIAAIGYCFGGLCVLDLARSGADIKAAVSFHGLLLPNGDVLSPIKSKILVLHGYDDPLVKPDQVSQFALEMTTRKADWQVHLYGGTAHSFTNPLANDPTMGLHYNKQSDMRSWQSTENFLKEVFNQ